MHILAAQVLTDVQGWNTAHPTYSDCWRCLKTRCSSKLSHNWAQQKWAQAKVQLTHVIIVQFSHLSWAFWAFSHYLPSYWTKPTQSHSIFNPKFFSITINPPLLKYIQTYAYANFISLIEQQAAHEITVHLWKKKNPSGIKAFLPLTQFILSGVSQISSGELICHSSISFKCH